MEEKFSSSLLNVPEIIKKLRKRGHHNKEKQFFPYIETYENIPSTNIPHNKLIKYRDSFSHNNTLKFNEPFFDRKKIFSTNHIVLAASQSPKLNPVKISDSKKFFASNILKGLDIGSFQKNASTKKCQNCTKPAAIIRKNIQKSSYFKYFKKNEYKSLSPDILQISTMKKFLTPKPEINEKFMIKLRRKQRKINEAVNCRDIKVEVNFESKASLRSFSNAIMNTEENISIM